MSNPQPFNPLYYFFKEFTIFKAATIFFFIGFLIYGNMLFNGFVGDDTEQIINNTSIHSMSQIPQLFVQSFVNPGIQSSFLGTYYKPLMLTYFFVTRHFFGTNPFFYHLPQLLFHIGNTILVYVFFQTVFGYVLKNNKKIAFILSLFFLVHPINQETTAYISNIQDIMFFFFGMLGLVLLCKRSSDLPSPSPQPSLTRTGEGQVIDSEAQTRGGEGENIKETNRLQLKISGQIIFYIFAGISFLLALFFKETTILFFPMVILFWLLFIKKHYLPFVFTTSIPFIFYIILRLSSTKLNSFRIEPSPMMKLSFEQRLLNIPEIIFYYFKTVLFPKDLAMSQQWTIKNITFSNFYFPLIIVLLVTFVLLFICYKLYQTKNTYFKLYFFFLAWFVIGILLHIHLIPLDMTVADRWFYFPFVGLLGMIGIFVLTFQDLFPLPRWERMRVKTKLLFRTTLITLLIFLSLRTMNRNTDWQNGLILYNHDIAISKDSALLENNLGNELFNSGNTEEAVKHFQKAVELNPKWWVAWNNLGIYEEQRKNYPKAKEYYRIAIDGDFFPAYENYARLLLLYENPTVAKKFCVEALKKHPQSAKLWITLALSHRQLNNKKEALEEAKHAFELMPDEKIQNVINQIRQETQ